MNVMLAIYASATSLRKPDLDLYILAPYYTNPQKKKPPYFAKRVDMLGH